MFPLLEEQQQLFPVKHRHIQFSWRVSIINISSVVCKQMEAPKYGICFYLVQSKYYIEHWSYYVVVTRQFTINYFPALSCHAACPHRMHKATSKWREIKFYFHFGMSSKEILAAGAQRKHEILPGRNHNACWTQGIANGRTTDLDHVNWTHPCSITWGNDFSEDKKLKIWYVESCDKFERGYFPAETVCSLFWLQIFWTGVGYFHEFRQFLGRF